MSNIWKFLSCFEFIGKAADLTIGGASLYYIYTAALFAGFCAYMVFLLVKSRRELFPGIFLKPTLYLAAALAFFFYYSGSNNLYSAYTYEVQNLADAFAAVDAGNLSLLLRQTRVVPLIFAAALYLFNLKGLIFILCLVLGLFYAVWERILEEVFGAKPIIAVLLALTAAALNKQAYYFFSAYSIFALFFSALFLYRLLLLLKDEEKDPSLFRLAQPVFLILMAALFRQESVALFPVYFTGLLFLKKSAAKKAAACLLAGAVLYLPFLYRDWTHEENQLLRQNWDQAFAERFYDGGGTRLSPEEQMRNSLLFNVICTLKSGSRYKDMDRQEFLDAARTTYLTQQPSALNVWHNLKYRSALFLRLSAGWLALFAASLFLAGRLRSRVKYLAALSAYIWFLFLIYHLASLAISIELSYNYLIPAYLAYGLVVFKGLYERAKPAA